MATWQRFVTNAPTVDPEVESAVGTLGGSAPGDFAGSTINSITFFVSLTGSGFADDAWGADLASAGDASVALSIPLAVRNTTITDGPTVDNTPGTATPTTLTVQFTFDRTKGGDGGTVTLNNASYVIIDYTPPAPQVDFDGTNSTVDVTTGDGTLDMARNLTGSPADITVTTGVGQAQIDKNLTGTLSSITITAGDATLNIPATVELTGSSSITITTGDGSMATSLEGEPATIDITTGDATLVGTHNLDGLAAGIEITAGDADLFATGNLIGLPAAIAVTTSPANLDVVRYEGLVMSAWDGNQFVTGTLKRWDGTFWRGQWLWRWDGTQWVRED